MAMIEKCLVVGVMIIIVWILILTSVGVPDGPRNLQEVPPVTLHEPLGRPLERPHAMVVEFERSLLESGLSASVAGPVAKVLDAQVTKLRDWEGALQEREAAVADRHWRVRFFSLVASFANITVLAVGRVLKMRSAGMRLPWWLQRLIDVCLQALRSLPLPLPNSTEQRPRDEHAG
ncbi:MAG: hypothetical protein AB1486_10410 [Planctomycetota bacterium]